MSSSSSSLAGHSSSSRRRASSTYNGTSGINSLYEFLEEAELQHHYLGLRNVLRVQSVNQLRSVREDDLVGIGMSQKEALRLRVRAHSSAGASSAKVNLDRSHLEFTVYTRGIHKLCSKSRALVDFPFDFASLLVFLVLIWLKENCGIG